MAQMERDVIRTLNKLFAAGATSEKEVSALTVQDMLGLPGITVTEMKIITQLQEAIRKKAVIRYLSGADEGKEDMTTNPCIDRLCKSRRSFSSGNIGRR